MDSMDCLLRLEIEHRHRIHVLQRLRPQRQPQPFHHTSGQKWGGEGGRYSCVIQARDRAGVPLAAFSMAQCQEPRVLHPEPQVAHYLDDLQPANHSDHPCIDVFS